MELHTTQRRVPFGDILVLYGQQKDIANTAWLIQHGFGLLQEYTHRYGKDTFLSNCNECSRESV